MLFYEFRVPYIDDDINLKSSFGKKSIIGQDNVKNLEGLQNERKGVRATFANIRSAKKTENVADVYCEQVRKYAETVSSMQIVLENDFKSSKHLEWQPIYSMPKKHTSGCLCFSTTKRCLRYGGNTKFAKSGEIIMSKYAYFATLFHTCRQEIRFINDNFNFNQTTTPNMTVSALKQDDPVVKKLEDDIRKVLKIHCTAYEFMKTAKDQSKKQIEALAFDENNYVESKAIGLDAALLICRINANILYVEYLKRKENLDEMGKYAKSICSQGLILETLLRPNFDSIDPNLVEFILVSTRLYKAIALWSMLHPLHAKMKAERYDEGESFNKLGYTTVSFVNHISQLQKEIEALPNIKKSPIYGHIQYYFTQVMGTKIHEIFKVYGQAFKDKAYDDVQFNHLKEIDYVTQSTGEGRR